MHVPFPTDAAWLKSGLLRLVEANSAWNATLRVVVVRNHGGLWEGPDQTRDFDLIAFTGDINPWGNSVRLAMKAAGRHAQNEFAGAKILSWAQNLTWYEEAHQRGFDEAVLLNERGEVSECTSANIFAVHGHEMWHPAAQLRLPAGRLRAHYCWKRSVCRVFRSIEKTLLPERSGTRRSGVHHIHDSRFHAGLRMSKASR